MQPRGEVRAWDEALATGWTSGLEWAAEWQSVLSVGVAVSPWRSVAVGVAVGVAVCWCWRRV